FWSITFLCLMKGIKPGCWRHCCWNSCSGDNSASSNTCSACTSASIIPCFPSLSLAQVLKQPQAPGVQWATCPDGGGADRPINHEGHKGGSTGQLSALSCPSWFKLLWVMFYPARLASKSGVLYREHLRQTP